MEQGFPTTKGQSLVKLDFLGLDPHDKKRYNYAFGHQNHKIKNV